MLAVYDASHATKLHACRRGCGCDDDRLVSGGGVGLQRIYIVKATGSYIQCVVYDWRVLVTSWCTLTRVSAHLAFNFGPLQHINNSSRHPLFTAIGRVGILVVQRHEWSTALVAWHTGPCNALVLHMVIKCVHQARVQQQQALDQ